MNVNASGSMMQMQSQMQMRKMDGSGQGNGQGGANGMKSVMQNLSSEDRVTLQNELSNISSEDNKAAIKDQMKQIDASNMDSSAYLNELLSLINPTTSEESTSFEVYA